MGWRAVRAAVLGAVGGRSIYGTHTSPSAPRPSIHTTHQHAHATNRRPPAPPPIKKVLKGKVDMTTKPWPTISDAAKDCINRMLVMDPKKRATANEILQVRKQ